MGKSLAAGCDGHIIKPVKKKILPEAILQYKKEVML